MRALVINYERQQELVDRQWTRLTERMQQHDVSARFLASAAKQQPHGLLPASVTHFRSAKALVGFIGLDPVFEQSGDEIIQKGISHRGSPALRQLLYMAARSAITCNPTIKKFCTAQSQWQGFRR